MVSKYCQSCKGTDNLKANSKQTLKDGTQKTYYLCRDCNTVLKRRYRKTQHGKAVTYGAIRRSQERTRNKVRARRMVMHHIQNGNIRKPDNCSRCPNENVEAHHEDYSYALDVIWLCRRCHADLHAKVGKLHKTAI